MIKNIPNKYTQRMLLGASWRCRREVPWLPQAATVTLGESPATARRSARPIGAAPHHLLVYGALMPRRPSDH